MSFQLSSIRHALAAFCFAALALPVSANCSITRDTGSSTEVIKAFRANSGYTFQNFYEVCEKLRKANALIFIHGTSGVLVNRSYGWAAISVADMANPQLVVTSFSSYSTHLSDYASSDEAQKSLWVAINHALEKWEHLDDALVELKKARAAMRKTVARK